MVATKEDVQDLRLAEHMQDLVNTPAWKIYEKILENHINEKMGQLLQPLHPIPGVEGVRDGMAHVLVGEAAKGAIMGLRLALTLPRGIVAGAEQIRKKTGNTEGLA